MLCLPEKNAFARLLIFVLSLLFVINFAASAQKKIIKIDLNQSGRQDAEVNEPGYQGWTLAANTVNVASFTPPSSGITITLTRKGPYGDKLSTNWYKAGIQTPYYARLANDGVRVNNGNAGAQIEMRISGLPAGRHSVLTYHNNVDNATTGTFAPIDVYADGIQKYDNLALSIRETEISKVPIAYMYVDAVAGQDVVLLYVADTTTGASIKNFMINGIEINTINSQYQARQPYPLNADEHVDADNGSLTLNWTNAPNGVASRIYFGQDSTSVAGADESSPLYKGRQTATTYPIGGQYSMLTYYWRIDQEDADGNITPGNVWYYRPRQLAFKEAQGYGRFARGGRGGKVVHVINLNDDGPGSFREAVTNDIGPRTIVFDVSGMITLLSRLTVSSNYITIAGQTAPGKGICLRQAPFGAGSNDVIMRHLRVRVGGPVTTDGMGLIGDNSIIDNCSISWTIDEAFSSRNAKKVTLQRTLISEALNVAGHQNYPAGTAHGYAATIGGSTGSFHHNLLAHCEGRNWSMGGGLDGNGFYAGFLDIRNNVVYNWHKRTTDGGAHQVNFVNNYYKPGASSTQFLACSVQHEGTGQGSQQVYFDGNLMPGHFDLSNQTAGRNSTITNNEIVNYDTFVAQPFFDSYVETQSAQDAYKRVLSNVGNTQPMTDDHDIRVINETLAGTYTYSGSVSGLPGLPDSQNDVGGWENYPEKHRPANWDTDNDGLPDWWEQLKGLNINSAAGDFSDANADPDMDGFTHLDNYLEWMGGPHYFTGTSGVLNINLALLARGYTNSPVFSVSNTLNGSVQLVASGADAGKLVFTPSAQGLASFDYIVTDAAGSSMSGTVNILANTDVAALPVTLVNFQAARKDPATVTLKWETAQESNNNYFEIQRALKAGGLFTTVTKLASKAPAGNSSVKLFYEATDANNATAKSYYRLSQTDLDGKTTLSEIRVVNGSDRTQDALIWPIPNKGKLNILLTGAHPATAVQLYSMDGKRVGSEEMVYPGITKQLTIASPGTYIIKGIDKQSGEILFTRKLVVQ